MKRPLGVTVVAAFFIINGAYGLAWRYQDNPFTEEMFSLKGPLHWIRIIAWLALSIDFLWPLAGIGLWRLRKWGRRLAIFLCLWALFAIPYTFVWLHFNRAVFGYELWQRGPWRLLQEVLFSVAAFGLSIGYMFTGQVKRAFSV